jgi:serine/threonine protein kinase
MENFEIINKLGSGGFSKVYKVKRKLDNKIYALKKVQILNLSEKQKMSSLNEIRVLASINSKYVVNYKEAFLDEKDSSLCLVMEYADRGDLENRIKEQKKKGKYFNEKDIWRVFIQLVKGLKALHDLEILHRDIKSSNIFLFSDGTAKLGDLNVCKILSKNILGHTQAGTPSYAAPEVWLEKPYGLKSDIWSLGCVLYETISLHCPFRGENVVELYNKILVGEFSRIPNKFSDELNWIVLHMINLNVDKRLSCDELLKCEYIRKRMELNKNYNLKSSSNKILKVYENEVKNNNNFDVNIGNNNNESNIFQNNNQINMNNNDNDDEIISNENIVENKQKLLKTIYMPNNLLYLGNQLPEPKYSLEIKSSYKSKSNKPIKITSELYNSVNINNIKINSENKRQHLSEIKKLTHLPSNILPPNLNLNNIFNDIKTKNNDIIDNIDKKNISNVNMINNNKSNIKGNFKLKHISSTLLSNNKNSNLSSENNNIYYRTGSQVPNKKNNLIHKANSLQENNVKSIQKILSVNNKLIENDLKEKEIEMKNHFFLDNDKLKSILCKKRIKKIMGIKKI